MKVESYTERLNRLTDRINVQERKLSDVIRKLNEKSEEVLMFRKYIQLRIKRDFQALYKEFYVLQQSDYYRTFFTDDGLLYYFACMWGYMQHYMPEGTISDSRVVNVLIGRYMVPIQNALVLLRGQLDKHRLDEPENLKIEMNLYGIETSNNFLELDERLQHLHGLVDEKRHETNHLFYERLWMLVEPLVASIEDEFLVCLEQDGATVPAVEVRHWVLQLRAALEAGGLSVAEPVSDDVCANDAGCYVQSRNADFSIPMIRRESDGYIFVKGILPVTE